MRDTGWGPPHPYRVVDRRVETADTVTFRLRPAGEPVPAPAPGQFMMLSAFGVGEVPISVSAVDGGRLTHTIRAVGAVSRALCGTEPGGTLGVRGPYGVGWPLAAGGDLLVVGGGIGLAPLRPVIHAALEHRARYGRVLLVAGARTPSDLLYEDDLAAWQESDAIVTEVTVDSAGSRWHGHVGFVTRPLARLRLDPAATTAYLCGPEAMMRFCARDLTTRGVPAGRIWVSLERNMRCGDGVCGHCQLGPVLICRDGPVLSWDRATALLATKEL